MAWQVIKKSREGWCVVPNLLGYEQTRTAFSWKAIERELDRLPENRGLNIAYESVDRHAEGERRDHLALRWLGKQGEVRDFSYSDLQRLINRFANVLRELGVGKGDRVFMLAGRIPELYITALGTLKNGSVFCPLFSAFGPEPIQQRLAIGEGKVLVTTAALYRRRKVAEVWESLPHLQHVLLIGSEGENARVEGANDFHRLMSAAGDQARGCIPGS